jgi:hypothetical protein
MRDQSLGLRLGVASAAALLLLVPFVPFVQERPGRRAVRWGTAIVIPLLTAAARRSTSLCRRSSAS